MASPVGLKAEGVVADKLTEQDFIILARNWSTPRCEIDLVAKKDGVVYIVEVKYRGAEFQGSGFEHIGPRKLQQLMFAAAVWSKEYGWDGDMRILAAAVSGPDFDNVELVEL